jgi:putative phosphoribosyl transferase
VVKRRSRLRLIELGVMTSRSGREIMNDTAVIPFQDRQDAGQQLAKRLTQYAGRPDVIVLGLPRGGIPVAYEVARALHAPLDTFLVRKLGVPGHEELAMGAIASGGLRILNADVLRDLPLPPETIDAVEANERRELARREQQFRDNRPPIDVNGRTVILVDDGLATGSTMRVAAEAIRRMRPKRLIAAAPVAAAEVCEALGQIVDEMVCLATPRRFAAVGLWYEDFDQTTDAEVRDLLARSQTWAPTREPAHEHSAG